MQRIAFEIGGFAIHWYGVLVAAGFLWGLTTAIRRGARDGIAGEAVVDLTLWLVVGTIVGARLLYVFTHWDQFAREPLWRVMDVRSGGLVFYGGFAGAVVAGLGYVRWKRLDFWRMADAVAPSIALGQAVGRLGCLMNGCCYGRPTEAGWAIHYPLDHETGGAGVHPTQVYESLLSLALYGLLAGWYRRRSFKGQIFCAYLVGYALLRSAVEFFRGDYGASALGRMTPGQAASVVAFLAGVILWTRLRRAPQALEGG